MHPNEPKKNYLDLFKFFLVSLCPLFIFTLYNICSTFYPLEQSWIWPLIIHSCSIAMIYGLVSIKTRDKIFRLNRKGLCQGILIAAGFLVVPMVFSAMEVVFFQKKMSFLALDLFNKTTGFSLLFFVILIPIVEEIFFRGCLSYLFIQNFGDHIGRLYSVLCFSMLHDSTFFAIGPFLLGLLCEWFQWRYKNLSNCIIIHSCANFSALLFMNYSPYFFEILKTFQIFI